MTEAVNTEAGNANREEYWTDWASKNEPEAIGKELARKEALAETDPLTELKDRRGWNNGLPPLLALARENRWDVSFAVIDIDGLKRINDEWGHEGGDQVIIFLGNILESCFRRSDLLARIGGDEFYACMAQTNEKEAKMMVERIVNTISRAVREMKEMEDGEGELSLIYKALPSISIGLSQLRVGESAEKAIKRADQGMYIIKRNK